VLRMGGCVGTRPCDSVTGGSRAFFPFKMKFVKETRVRIKQQKRCYEKGLFLEDIIDFLWLRGGVHLIGSILSVRLSCVVGGTEG
jgi:hypothetical protein